MNERTSQYRSKCRIYADILHSIQNAEGAKAAYLLHAANLSYERLMTHLNKMIELGLIEKTNGDEMVKYSITDAGKKYLAEFRKVEEFGNMFGIEI